MSQNYSLIEYKLRRYFHLGHEYSMYISSPSRKKFWKQNPRNLDDSVCVRIIGKIVKKNKTKEINSIVPIILKVKNEKKLLDDKYLIFALAVCAKFNLKQCSKMVSDAYKAVSSICTDGLKLLMFVKFCQDANATLLSEGYISKIPTGVGNGFRKAIKKWYLSKDPLLTTEQIVKDKHYEGWTHKGLMKLLYLNSNDPSRKLFITYTKCGMIYVEKLFKSQIHDNERKNGNETFEEFQLKYIYDYLKQVERMKTMSEIELVNEIEIQRWGHEFKVIPRNMMKKPFILASLVVHMPLRDVLDNTFFFAKQKLFIQKKLNVGITEYILRFNNSKQLQTHHIHPIESYLEYVKYSRTFKRILKAQSDFIKRNGISKFNEVHKVQYFIRTPKIKRLKNYPSTQQIDTKDNKKCITKFNNKKEKTEITEIQPKCVHLKSFKRKKKKKPKRQQIIKQVLKTTKKLLITIENKNEITDTTNSQSTLITNIQQNNPESMSEIVQDQVESDVSHKLGEIESKFVLMKAAPRLMDKLLKFLSKDLLQKSLKILKPTDKRILIAYDNRKEMTRFMCMSSSLLRVHEAITLITLSLIFPEKLENKPTILGLDEESEVDKVEYGSTLLFKQLENILFKESFDARDKNCDKKDISIINPLPVMTWARAQNKIYDIFVFLGTHKMNFRHIKYYMRNYQKIVGKPIKIIVCCLNGKHEEQRNLSHTNMLFISGFDKSVGKIIHSFIHGEF